MTKTLFCSFCGKSQHEVRHLIAGPTVVICNECVEICAGIVADAATTCPMIRRLNAWSAARAASLEVDAAERAKAGEREACALLADGYAETGRLLSGDARGDLRYLSGASDTAAQIAAKIRARSQVARP